jgi:glycosyltransferase involved in cell wall biosynthesis
MKKISLIISNILLTAGTERATVNLANNLNDQGNLVEIISVNSKCGNSFYPLNDGVLIKHLDCKTSRSLLKRLLISFKILYSLNKHIPQEGRVLIGTIHSLNILLAIVKFFSKKNIFIGCEHIGYEAATISIKLARRIFYKMLDAVVVLTENDHTMYCGIDKLNNCHVIPNQISFPPDISSTCDQLRILAIGRLTHQKGFDLMLEIVANVLPKYPKWELNIIGEGEMEGLLKNKIFKLNISGQVNILPFTKDIRKWFLDSSIYLMTSRFEGLPMVLLEAKACGLPIIAYDCPTGPAELIKHDDGFLVEMGDKHAFSQAMEDLMSNESLRKVMGTNAQANILEFTPDNIYRHWNSLFSRL